MAETLSPRLTRNAIFLVLVASLGYFVDIYDLLLFSIVRVRSLHDIGVIDSKQVETGQFIMNVQMFGLLLGGAAIVETVFAYPGMGKLLVDAISVRDYPQIQASIVILATIYILVNLLVDVLYAYIDPRIRTGDVKLG